MILFTVSCANTAQIEKAPGVDLSGFKTYSWAPDENETSSINRRKQIVNERIQAAVDKQLQKNGLTEVKSNPDVFVSTDLLVEKTAKENQSPVYSRSYSRTFYNRYNGRFYTYYFPSQFLGYENYTINVREGTVTVTLIDAKTDKAVWQGWATRELTQQQVSDKDIDKNVASIFKKFE